MILESITLQNEHLYFVLGESLNQRQSQEKIFWHWDASWQGITTKIKVLQNQLEH